jgi:hypothetical protein
VEDHLATLFFFCLHLGELFVVFSSTGRQCLILAKVRCAYRLIEGGQGHGGYLLTHEGKSVLACQGLHTYCLFSPSILLRLRYQPSRVGHRNLHFLLAKQISQSRELAAAGKRIPNGPGKGRSGLKALCRLFDPAEKHSWLLLCGWIRIRTLILFYRS